MILIIVHVFSANPYRTPRVNTPWSTALSSEFEFSPSTCTASSPDLVPLAPFPQNPPLDEKYRFSIAETPLKLC